MKKVIFTLFLMLCFIKAAMADAVHVSPTAGTDAGRLNQVVLGYSGIWYDSMCPPEDYNYGAMTYLARAFLTPRPDGSVMVPPGYFNAGMETMAKKHGVKLIMSIGGEAPDANNWLSVARHPEYFKRFCDELEKLAKEHDYDGIDIDWEPSPLTNEDGAAYTSFLKKLRARFPKMVITAALGASDYWDSHFPSWPDIYNSVDYINVMVYCNSGAWLGKADYASSLYPAGAYTPEPGLSADEEMKLMTQKYGVPAKKLLMGVTFWSSQFSVNHIGDAFPKDNASYCSTLAYPEVMRLTLTGNYKDYWDDKAGMGYMEKKSGGSVVCYENPKSIALKCDFAHKMGLSGVMIWNIGIDAWGIHTPLMDSLAAACGGKTQALPRDVLEKQVTDLQTGIQTAKAQLEQMNSAIKAAGKKEMYDTEPAAVHPGELSRLSDADLENARLQLEKETGLIQDRLAGARAIFTHLQTPHGKALDYTKPLEVSDFEKGNTLSVFGTSWQVDFDHSSLGTSVRDADSFISKGGANGSKYCAKIYGHFGRSEAPWPFATLSCDLSADGKPVDLSGFKAIQFWAKGDGKKYEVMMDNSKVMDYNNFRSEFVAPKKWTKVTLAMDSFHQGDWGVRVDWDANAVKRITFEPSEMSDEDFDLSIDDVTFAP